MFLLQTANYDFDVLNFLINTLKYTNKSLDLCCTLIVKYS